MPGTMRRLLIVAYACAALLAVAKGGVVLDKWIPTADLVQSILVDVPADPLPCPTSSELANFAVYITRDFYAERLIQKSTSMEEFRQAIREFCYFAVIKRLYYSKILKKSQRCSIPGQYQAHQIIIGMYETALNVSCVGYGDPMTDLYHAKSSDGSSLMDLLLQCLDTAGLTLKQVEQENLELDRAGKMLMYYRRFNDFEECLLPSVQDVEVATATVANILNEIRQRLQCIHPQLGTPVLCSEIDLGPDLRKGIIEARDSVKTPNKMSSIISTKLQN